MFYFHNTRQTSFSKPVSLNVSNFDEVLVSPEETVGSNQVKTCNRTCGLGKRFFDSALEDAQISPCSSASEKCLRGRNKEEASSEEKLADRNA